MACASRFGYGFYIFMFCFLRKLGIVGISAIFTLIYCIAHRCAGGFNYGTDTHQPLRELQADCPHDCPVGYVSFILTIALKKFCAIVTALFGAILCREPPPKGSIYALLTLVGVSVIFLARKTVIFTPVFLAKRMVVHRVSPPCQASFFQYQAKL